MARTPTGSISGARDYATLSRWAEQNRAVTIASKATTLCYRGFCARRAILVSGRIATESTRMRPVSSNKTSAVASSRVSSGDSELGSGVVAVCSEDGTASSASSLALARLSSVANPLADRRRFSIASAFASLLVTHSQATGLLKREGTYFARFSRHFDLIL
jgi:hypothetical protein